MNQKLLTAALTLIVAIASPLALAAGNAELKSYFQELEGRWEGRGSIRQVEFDGSQQTVGMNVEFRFERSSDQDWTVTSEIRTDTGTISSSQNGFSVRGDLLFITANSPLEPVRVLESTPLSLSFQMRRADFFSGRVYDFTFQTVLAPSLRELSAHHTTELNGVVIVEENFTAKRW